MTRRKTLRKTNPKVAQETVTRRSWMEWVGKSAVLSLSAGVLARCTTDATGQADAGGLPDATGLEAGVDAAIQPPCTATPASFPFQPVDDNAELFQPWNGWNVRTVDTQDLPSILSSWQLTVDGMVANPVTLSFADLLDLPRQDQVTDFHCVEGWSVYDVPWNGVHLSDVLSLVQPNASATHITFHTVGDEYNESLPLDIALEPKTMMAYGVNCNTMPLNHGFPLRTVIPRLLGYKNAKYVYRVELTDAPIEGFWVRLGYGYDGEVPPARLREGHY